MKKNSAILLFLFILIESCSNLEPVDKKISRFNPQKENQIYVPNLLSERINDFKSPSSVTSLIVPQIKKDISTKKLYFLTITNELQSLYPFTSLEFSEQLNICPQFHTTVINKEISFYKNKKLSKFNYNFDEIIKVSKSKSGKLPIEFYLPIKNEQFGPTVKDLIFSESNPNPEFIMKNLKLAVDLHFQKINSEMIELCRYSYTDQFYIFENIISQYSNNNNNSANVETLQVLAKTFFYNNMALIKSLKNSLIDKDRVPASENAIGITEKETLNQMGLVWAHEVLQKL